MVDENGKYLNKASNANNDDQSLGGLGFTGGTSDAAAKAKLMKLWQFCGKMRNY